MSKKNLLKPTNRRFFFAKQPPKMKMLQEVYSNYIFEPLEREYFCGVFEFKVYPTFRMNDWQVIPNISYNISTENEEFITISVMYTIYNSVQFTLCSTL